jgi:hypothetical protein
MMNHLPILGVVRRGPLRYSQGEKVIYGPWSSDVGSALPLKTGDQLKIGDLRLFSDQR